MWLNSLRSTNEVSWSHAEQLITNQLINIYADVAQLAEQLICNQQVIGSSPIIGFFEGTRVLEQGPLAQLVRAPPCHGGGRGFESRLGRSGSLAQLGEHLPYKQRVIGSSPIGPIQ